MLWKWYKTDFEVCHYLFGTMHTASDNAYKYAGLAEKYITLSAVYAAEMDLNDTFGFNMMSYFKIEDNGTLRLLYSPRHYKKMKSVIQKAFEVNLDQFQEFSPFFISNMLAGACIKSHRSEALDHYLWKFAMSAGKEMTGLESLEDQINILKQIPMAFQVRSLKGIANNVSAFRQKVITLDEQYGRGDIRGLYLGARSNLGVIRKLMTTERNNHMTEKLISLASGGTVFAGVGAAHLYGRDGMLALLKRKGFKTKLITV